MKELRNNPLAANPYDELSIREREDYLELVYEFAVNDIWKQVKALNARLKSIAGRFVHQRAAAGS